MHPLAQLREKLKLSQAELATKTGMSYGSIQRYEQGATPSPGARQKIAEVAAQYGVGDIVDDWLADREGTSSTPVVGSLPAKDDQRWVDLLLGILHSGHSVAIRAVQENLQAFSRLVKVDVKLTRGSADKQE